MRSVSRSVAVGLLILCAWVAINLIVAAGDAGLSAWGK